MSRVGTVGQLLFNAALPKDFRQFDKVIDGKSLTGILQNIAEQKPSEYKDTLMSIKKFADRSAYVHSEISYDDFLSPIDHKKIISDFSSKIPFNASDDEVRTEFSKLQDIIDKKTMAGALKNDNSMALQILSGARGSSSQLSSTISSPVMYADNFGTPIRVPITNSFSEGLTGAEYWASTYGTRKGVIATKFATPKGGYFGKQLGYVLNTTMVTEEDCETKNGIEADINDSDNIGRVLAQNSGGVQANTLLTSQHISDMNKKGVKKFLIRSPISCEAEAGLCQKCRGFTEQGRVASIGENVGQNSAHALSESTTQAAMKEKHTGGQVGTANKGILDTLNQLVKVPKFFAGGSTVSEVDGTVQSIQNAPQGGYYVLVNNKEHYIHPGFDIIVKAGDKIEAGHPLSNGIVNPADVTRLRGLGEGRRYLSDSIRSTLASNRLKINKVHSESLAKALVNLTQVTADVVIDDNVPGDIVQFNHAQKHFNPINKSDDPVEKSEGKYLTKPYMHFTAGTKLKPSMINTMKSFGINNVEVSTEKPPFEPVMIRMDDVPGFKDSWMGRLFSSNLKKKILGAVQRTEESPIHGTDFIPSYVTAREFGRPGIGKTYGY